ncbi:MAG: hypothetical protein JNJ88_03685 [Planctomycetes bacterium]|nr:hypothetical protein [Planctomycetota bacterium]
MIAPHDPPPGHEPTLGITILAGGRTTTQGKYYRWEGTEPFAAWNAQILDALPPKRPWMWSPCRWENDSRSRQSGWIAASGIVVDIDCGRRNAGGKLEKAAIPTDFVERFAPQLALGSFWHATPHGLRMALLFGAPACDLESWKTAARGAVVWTHELLQRAKLDEQSGSAVFLHIDEGATTDAKRAYFAPRGTVDGEARNALIHLGRSAPFTLAELAAHALPPTPPEPPKSAGRGNPNRDLDDAVARYLRDRNSATAQWPTNPDPNYPCPACGHRDSFHRTPEDHQRWFCFSTNHGADAPGCGTASASGFVGSVLDLDAFAAGRPGPRGRVEHLRAEGYLDPGRRSEHGDRVRFPQGEGGAPNDDHSSHASGVPSSSALRKLREILAAHLFREDNWRWFGAKAARYGVAEQVVSLVPNDATLRAAFQSGARTKPSALPQPPIPDREIKRIERALEHVGEPEREPAPDKKRIEGLDILELHRVVADVRDEGVFSLSLSFQGQKAHLTSVDGKTLTSWKALRARVASYGLLLPSFKGCESAWASHLLEAQKSLGTKIVTSAETSSGALREVICRCVREAPPCEEEAELANGAIQIDRDPEGSPLSYRISKETLIRAVKEAMEDERVTRPDILAAVASLGATTVEVVSSTMKRTLDLWRFDAAIVGIPAPSAPHGTAASAD